MAGLYFCPASGRKKGDSFNDTMTNLERAQDLYRMVFTGQLLEAFDKYYGENVTMTEIGETPRVGKAFNREYEQKFLSSVEGFHDAGITAIASNEETGYVLIENWMDVTMSGAGRMKMEQVNVQRWEDGVIVDEKFYHK